MRSDFVEKIYNYSWEKITTTFWQKYCISLFLSFEWFSVGFICFDLWRTSLSFVVGSFFTLCSSFWQRFSFPFLFSYSPFLGHPKCAHSRAFVTSRYIDEQGRLVTKRLHVISQDVPSFIKALVGTPVSYAGEESVVDPVKKTLTMKTINLSMGCLATIDELCRYTSKTDNTARYVKKLNVFGHCNSFINSTVEDWCISVDAANRFNGFKVMEEIASDIDGSIFEILTEKIPSPAAL